MQHGTSSTYEILKFIFGNFTTHFTTNYDGLEII